MNFRKSLLQNFFHRNKIAHRSWAGPERRNFVLKCFSESTLSSVIRLYIAEDAIYQATSPGSVLNILRTVSPPIHVRCCFWHSLHIIVSSARKLFAFDHFFFAIVSYAHYHYCRFMHFTIKTVHFPLLNSWVPEGTHRILGNLFDFGAFVLGGVWHRFAISPAISMIFECQQRK